MQDVLIPILTLLLGQLLGYWFAVSRSKRAVSAEKRAEYVSRFIGTAYQNLRYLTSAQAVAEAGAAVPELTVLGDQAGFFVSDESAAAIDALTSEFARALADRADPERDRRRDVFQEYKARLDEVRRLLRRELQASE